MAETESDIKKNLNGKISNKTDCLYIFWRRKNTRIRVERNNYLKKNKLKTIRYSTLKWTSYYAVPGRRDIVE